MDAVEASNTPGSGSTESRQSAGKKAGFVMLKDIKLPIFNDKDEDWKWWQDDTTDYLDSTTPGVAALFSTIEKQTMPIEDFALGLESTDSNGC